MTDGSGGRCLGGKRNIEFFSSYCDRETCERERERRLDVQQCLGNKRPLTIKRKVVGQKIKKKWQGKKN